MYNQDDVVLLSKEELYASVKKLDAIIDTFDTMCGLFQNLQEFGYIAPVATAYKLEEMKDMLGFESITSNSYLPMTIDSPMDDIATTQLLAELEVAMEKLDRKKNKEATDALKKTEKINYWTTVTYSQYRRNLELFLTKQLDEEEVKDIRFKMPDYKECQGVVDRTWKYLNGNKHLDRITRYNQLLKYTSSITNRATEYNKLVDDYEKWYRSYFKNTSDMELGKIRILKERFKTFFDEFYNSDAHDMNNSMYAAALGKVTFEYIYYSDWYKNRNRIVRDCVRINDAIAHDGKYLRVIRSNIVSLLGEPHLIDELVTRMKGEMFKRPLSWLTQIANIDTHVYYRHVNIIIIYTMFVVSKLVYILLPAVKNNR